MHQPIKDRLEEYLSGMADSESEQKFEDHLASCPACRRAIEEMRRQSGLLRMLRQSREMDPAPGFYARVLDRIESQRIPSIWELLLEPVFGRRLAYASLSLLLLLSTILVTTGGPNISASGFFAYSPESILAQEPVGHYYGDDLERDREAVLVNLATYEY